MAKEGVGGGGSKRGTLLDAGGQVISKPAPPEEPLPAAVQALIEARVSAAVCQMRELNRADLRELSHQHVKRWRWVAAVMTLGTVISWFYAPQQIKGWIREYVNERMTEPRLRQAADEAIRKGMDTFITNKLSPLSERTDALDSRIGTLSVEITEKQDRLRADQDTLSKQVRAQRLAISAKAGSVADFSELQEVARNSDGDLQAAARAALTEIELHFDADRGQISYKVFADSITKQTLYYPTDEAIVVLLSDLDPGNREAAVNVMTDTKAVQVLCDRVATDDNLRVRARITRSLEQLVKLKVRPLDFEAAKSWCQTEGQSSSLRAPYSSLPEARNLLMAVLAIVPRNASGLRNLKDAEHARSLLNETILADPDALYARALRGAVLTTLDQLEDAESDFQYVLQKQGDYRWALLWRALLLLRLGKDAEAVGSLNRAMTVSPSLEVHVRNLAAFAPLRSDSRVLWPSALQAKPGQ